MEHQLPNPPKVTLYTGLFLLVTFALILIIYSVATFAEMSQQLSDGADAFAFNKGVFYIPGVVLGLCVLIYAIIRESVLRKQLTEYVASLLTRMGIGAVILMVSLPNLAELLVQKHIAEHNYQICDKVSHEWLHSKITIYTMDKAACDRLME